MGRDKDDDDLAKAQAAALGISIDEFLLQDARDRLRASGASAWMKYAGFVETGDAHSSQAIDDLIYGTGD